MLSDEGAAACTATPQHWPARRPSRAVCGFWTHVLSLGTLGRQPRASDRRLGPSDHPPPQGCGWPGLLPPRRWGGSSGAPPPDSPCSGPLTRSAATSGCRRGTGRWRCRFSSAALYWRPSCCLWARATAWCRPAPRRAPCATALRHRGRRGSPGLPCRGRRLVSFRRTPISTWWRRTGCCTGRADWLPAHSAVLMGCTKVQVGRVGASE